MANFVHRLFAVAVAAVACLATAGSADAAQVQGMLPVPSVTIYPGDVIAAEMLTERPFYFDPNLPLAVIDSVAPILGKVARRTLIAGKPIPNNSFGDPTLITRGQPTEARFEAGTLIITATVMPLQSGALGSLIQARNLDSGQMIAGIVQSDGSLLVGSVR